MNVDTTENVVLGILGVVTALGGLLGWLVKRTFGHTIPRLSKTFEKALVDQRTELISALDRQRGEFIAALQEERERNSSAINELRSDMREDRQEFLKMADALRSEITTLGIAVVNSGK